MPAYNAEPYILDSIQCVLNQTHSNLELLIFDDGSTDQTWNICQQMADLDSRIRLQRSPQNMGNLKATNILFESVSGQFIAIQDADDLCAPTKLERQLIAFSNSPQLAIVGCNYLKISESGSPVFSSMLPLTNAEIKKEMLRKSIPVLYASALIPTKIAKKAGPFSPFFNRQGYADLDWLARCSLYGEVQNLWDALYMYRQHPQAFSFQKAKSFFGTPYMELLLVEAHHQRLRGEVDFFQKRSKPRIKQYMLNWHMQRAMDCFLERELLLGCKALFYAFRLNPFSPPFYVALFYNLKGLIAYIAKEGKTAGMV